ncbi:MAG: response regulator [Anaerolineae bacterium]
MSSILVVDDTPANLSLLVNLLTKRDYKVRAAKDGFSALRSAFNNPPDLVLLDISMPDMDGYEVCEKLKADARTQDIPVIFISAMDDTDKIIRAFEVGGVDYVTKPFQFREVLARVESHLTLVHQRRELIRQREEIESLREQDAAQFEAINKMREQFIYAATHDLKNPLALITGYVSLLQSDDRVTGQEDLYQYVQGIRSGSKKMLRLIQDLLDLIQIESSNMLALEPIEINSFVGSIVEEFATMAEQGHLRLAFYPAQPLDLYIDAHRMEQVITNLVSNAIKYTPAGGHVEVRVEAVGNQAVIQVIDDGLGIPEAAQKRIFDPFYRVSEPSHRAIEGSGLGLSIVRSIVEQHEGQITLQSQPGKGSAFSVLLPKPVLKAELS